MSIIISTCPKIKPLFCRFILNSKISFIPCYVPFPPSYSGGRINLSASGRSSASSFPLCAGRSALASASGLTLIPLFDPLCLRAPGGRATVPLFGRTLFFSLHPGPLRYSACRVTAPVLGRTLFSLFSFSLDGKGTKDQALIKKTLEKGSQPLKRASPSFSRPASNVVAQCVFLYAFAPPFPRPRFFIGRGLVFSFFPLRPDRSGNFAGSRVDFVFFALLQTFYCFCGFSLS